MSFSLKNSWWAVLCCSYLSFIVQNVTFFFLLLMTFSLILVFSNLIMMCPSVVFFFMFLLHCFCWASWIFGSRVFNKFRKNLTIIFIWNCWCWLSQIFFTPHGFYPSLMLCCPHTCRVCVLGLSRPLQGSQLFVCLSPALCMFYECLSGAFFSAIASPYPSHIHMQEIIEISCLLIVPFLCLWRTQLKWPSLTTFFNIKLS